MSDRRLLSWLKLARLQTPLKLIHMALKTYNNDPIRVLEYLPVHTKRAKNVAEFVEPNDQSCLIEIENVEKYGAKMIHYESNDYPKLLKQIGEDAPLVLTVKGRVDLLHSDKKIAIVGTRRPTVHGLKITTNIVQDLVQKYHAITISGLAQGVDSVVHTSSINSGTIAVLGNGINVNYPKENQKLQTFIESSGLVISSVPYNTKPIPRNFPERNKIIVGLASAVVVIEAKKNSGSMVTARLASAYNRELFTIPGSLFEPNYAGNNYLIKNNLAKMIESADDIYLDIQSNFLNNNFLIKDYIDDECDLSEGGIVDLNDIDSAKDEVLNSISIIPSSIDDISFITKIPIHLIRSVLLELQISEQIISKGNDMYYRVV